MGVNRGYITFQSTLPMRGETQEHDQNDGREDEFQSTLPMRGETEKIREKQIEIDDFNPLSPCGERRKK